jgi:hypothetical protein
MKPLIDIHRDAAAGFTYCISALGAEGVQGGTAFDTVERCLRDAAASLGQYFPRVHVRFEGGSVHPCTIDMLRREPQAVVALISQQAVAA